MPGGGRGPGCGGGYSEIGGHSCRAPDYAAARIRGVPQAPGRLGVPATGRRGEDGACHHQAHGGGMYICMSLKEVGHWDGSR